MPLEFRSLLLSICTLFSGFGFVEKYFCLMYSFDLGYQRWVDETSKKLCGVGVFIAQNDFLLTKNFTCFLIIPFFFSASVPSICVNGGNSSPSRRDARDMVLSSLPPFCIAQHQEASEHETGIPREGAPHSLPPKSPFFCTSFLFFRAVEWIQVARFNLRRRVRDEGKKRKVSEYRIYPPLTLSKC